MQFEDAARESADELTQPRPEGEEHLEDIQVLLKSDANPVQIRDLRVRHTLSTYSCTCIIVHFIYTVCVYASYCNITHHVGLGVE